jgi:polar amino acid transport system substrate-binding protein
MRLLLSIGAALLLLCGAASRAWAETPSAWSEIMSTKKIKVCVIPSYPPYSSKDASGEWQGFSAVMAKDVAKDLHVEPVFVDTSLSTVVLDLQSDKCHVFFAFNATPERALAVDFAGPVYTLGFIFVNRKGWKPPGNHWTDLNDPNTRICYTVGNSVGAQIMRFAPKAQLTALADTNDCVLALLAGRVDTYGEGLMGGLGAKQKNSNLGDLMAPMPPLALPSYAGLRIDSDGRLQKFLQRWAEFNRANGNVTEWLLNALEAVGIKRDMIPPDEQF